MERRALSTPSGVIAYWRTPRKAARRPLVFLPGLTADHRLFDRQVESLGADFDVLVWDAPGHGESRPFKLDFTLMDKARWLRDILEREQIDRPILVGQSMGGYVAQCFMQRWPGAVRGFISIDSCPLQRRYVTGLEIALLRHTEGMYRAFPWRWLRRVGANGCAETEYGRDLMRAFIDSYSKSEYCALAGHGFRMLADAMAADLPYRIDCPALLICGERDHAGSARRYNAAWAKSTGFRLEWIAGAGHNANADAPDRVNELIRAFAEPLD